MAMGEMNYAMLVKDGSPIGGIYQMTGQMKESFVCRQARPLKLSPL